MSLPIRFQYGLPCIASFTENITGCIPIIKNYINENRQRQNLHCNMIGTKKKHTNYTLLTKIKLRIGFFIVYDIEDIWCMFSANHIWYLKIEPLMMLIWINIWVKHQVVFPITYLNRFSKRQKQNYSTLILIVVKKLIFRVANNFETDLKFPHSNLDSNIKCFHKIYI